MNAVRLFFEESGQGIPIILLHGYPLDHTIWQPLIPFMNKEARLIMPDLRGYGQSPVTDGIYSMQLLAGDVLNLMDELEIRKAVLAGHSMGGYVALSFAQAFPKRLSGLALVASHCFKDDPEKAKGRLETASRVEQTGQIDFIVCSMLPNLTAEPRHQKKLEEMMLKAKPKSVSGILRGMAERETTCSVLHEMVQPAVIIAGGKDRLIPIEHAKKMAAVMRNSWLEVIPEAGHMPMLEAPEKVAYILNLLLEKVNSSNRSI